MPVLAALPFAHLLTFLVSLGIFAFGLLMVLAGRRLCRPLFWPGAALMSLVAALFIAGMYRDAMLEWNPLIREDAEIVGTWSDGRETITLHGDHRFDYHSPNKRFSGTWSRNDFTLSVDADGGRHQMRFVRYGSTIHLLSRLPEDLDDWDGDLGLDRVP